jgi:hypothetical protein
VNWNNLDQLVDSAILAREVPPLPSGESRIETVGGFQLVEISTVNSIGAFPRVVPIAGYGLVYLRDGSTPGNRIDVTAGSGKWANMAPGDSFRARFNELRLELGSRHNASSAFTVSGDTADPWKTPTARFLIITNPGVQIPYLNPLRGSLGYFPITQTLAATTNDPDTIGAGIGMTLADVRGYRVRISANSGQTLTSGEVRMWCRSPALQVWGRNPDISWTISGGARVNQFPDIEVVVPYGGIYAEAYNVAASGGSNLLVEIETWG